MNVDRGVPQEGNALEKIQFCLNQLEKAKNFRKGIGWETEVVRRLTIEELIGALVHAEIEMEWRIGIDKDRMKTQK